jgi:uncharacterized RDD family membrane protein YckC
VTNPYAPPQAAVQDIADPYALAVLADRGTRLGAAILDGVIFAGMVYLPMVFAFVGIGSAEDSPQDPRLAVGAAVVTAVGFIVWCWLTIKYVLRNGQSIAKKLLDIKVVRSDGSRASFARIFWLRNVVNSLISIIPLYGLIDVLFIFGESRQCLHDKIADTIVVKA